MLALLPKGDVNVQLDHGQHYEAAAIIGDAAE